MKICEKCGVSVSGGFERCPLCKNTLAKIITTENGEKEYETFPFVPLVKQKHNLLYRLFKLFTAAAVIGSAAVNLMLPESGFWSLFVAGGAACLWIGTSVAIRKRKNILKNVTYQATFASVFSVLWDIFTGWRGWSVDFVIPIAFVCAMSATAILARVLKMKTGTYIIYLFLLMIYGIIPAIFLASGLCRIVYPSFICVACSLFSFAALLIFEGGNMIEELKRRLHL